jgi:molecular chaperone IbpA
MTQLVRFDTNALNRALIGFDSMFDNFEQRFANQINNNYPPYNILKYDDNTFEIEIAVTGFDKNDVVVEVDQNQLVVRAKPVKVEGEATPEYLHRGLAARSFERSWTLAEHMVVGEGRIKNGVLSIGLTRIVPEALKPRVLKIKGE